MHNFEVVRRLTHNGNSLKAGDTLTLSAEDGKLLSDLGRVTPASKKAKAAVEAEQSAE